MGRSVLALALAALAASACASRPLSVPEEAEARDLAVDARAPAEPDLAVGDLPAQPTDLGLGLDLARSDLTVDLGDLAPLDLALLDLASPPQCTRDADCLSNACDALTLTCVADPCADHRQDGDESGVDCGGPICSPCPSGESCAQNGDCLSTACDGLSHRCVNNRCIDHQQDYAETDVDCGGANVCSRCRLGQKCTGAADCQVAHLCVGGRCVGLSCGDSLLDDSETAVDCGGPSCLGCSVGQACLLGRDCASLVCDGTAHTCSAASCSDGLRNAVESDVDCGGAGSCARCSLGKACTVAGDCASGACDASSRTCVSSTCADHQQDGAETDVDCGGGCGTCALYRGCLTGADCTSGSCDPTGDRCVPPACLDGMLDGNESDVDCGGECLPCTLGTACRSDQDCASHACDVASLVCIADQCSDGRREGRETDVDCGGPCAPCPLGEGCRDGPDCTSGYCGSGPSGPTCQVPPCQNGIQDGHETGVDCGGGLCAGCPLGVGCLIDADCASQACDVLTLACVADACSDHRMDDQETDVDCGGAVCAARCAAGKKCITSSDCSAGLGCPGGNPHICQ